jgi:hypothetical protein
MIARAGFDESMNEPTNQQPPAPPQPMRPVVGIEAEGFLDSLQKRLFVILFWLAIWWIPARGLSLGVAARFFAWASSTQ